MVRLNRHTLTDKSLAPKLTATRASLNFSAGYHYRIVWGQKSGLLGRFLSKAVYPNRLADLRSQVWPDFDDQARNPTDRLDFLELQARHAALGVRAGFIIIENDQTPVAMTPFFINHHSLDDGVVSPGARKLCRFFGLKHLLRWLGPPVSPLGMKYVNLGGIFNFTNQLYTAQPLASTHEWQEIAVQLQAAVYGLQKRYYAPSCQMLQYQSGHEANTLASVLHWQTQTSWPNTAIDLGPLRARQAQLYDKCVIARNDKLRLLAERKEAACHSKQERLALRDRIFRHLSKRFRHDADKTKRILGQISQLIDRYALVLTLEGKGPKAQRAQAHYAQSVEDLRKSFITAAQISNQWIEEVSKLKAILEEHRRSLIGHREISSDVDHLGGEIIQLEKELKRLGSRHLTLHNFSLHLPQHRRQTLHKKLAQFSQTPEYQMERLSGNAAKPLLPLIWKAYHHQYQGALIQWLPLSQAMIDEILDLPGSEVLVLWHQQTPDSEKCFVGFDLSLCHGKKRQSLRFGLMPEFSPNPGERNVTGFFAWYRFLLAGLEAAMSDPGIDEFLLGPTAYAAKINLGARLIPTIRAEKTFFAGVKSGIARKAGQREVSDVLKDY